MTDMRLLHDGMRLLSETLQGGPARRLTSAGIFVRDLVGGPGRLALLFAPVSPDAEAAAGFRERHENHMRAEVLAAVTRVLDRWGHECDTGCDQTHFDDTFIALAHLRLLMLRRRGEQSGPLIGLQVADMCVRIQHARAEKWFRPLINAKLSAPDLPPA